MFYVSIDFMRYSNSVSEKEALCIFDKACIDYPRAYVVIYNDLGRAVKERFSQAKFHEELLPR